MKLDHKNKKKLYNVLKAKISRIAELAPNPFVLEEEWARFLESHEIIQVERVSARCPWSNPCNPSFKTSEIVVISNPWLAESDFVLDKSGECRDPSCYGLRIPKDVAEKFLVLGVP